MSNINLWLIFFILFIQILNRKIKNFYFLNLNIICIFIVICYTEIFLVKFNNDFLRSIVFFILFILFVILSFSYVRIKNNCVIIKNNLFSKKQEININDIEEIEFKQVEYFDGISTSIILNSCNEKNIEINFIYVSFIDLIYKLKAENGNIEITKFKEIKNSNLSSQIAFFIMNLVIALLLINGFSK